MKQASQLPLAGLFLLSVALGGCSGQSKRKGTEPLPSGVAARVGSEQIDVATVGRIARAQGVTPTAASNRAIEDALYAVAARERLPSGSVRQAERSAFSRALFEDLQARAIAAGPPTDAEVAEATEARWWELDRPSLLRTTHAVVVVKKPEDDAAARALAERVAAAVSGIADPVAFRRAATSVPPGKLEVKVEDLDPVARDHRYVNPKAPPPPGTQTGEFAKEFVDAAYAIPAMGKQSPIVRSEFGYHVILAVEQIAEHRVALEERRNLLRHEILTHRALALRDALRESVRASARIDVARAAVELMQKAPP